MNHFIALLATVAVVCSAVGAHGDSIECPVACPQIYSPTCGTDGATFFQFDNACALEAFNCQRQKSALKKYAKTDIDWCTTTELDMLDQDLSTDIDKADPSCLKPCPMIYSPVCGSNGTFRKVFSNECEMNLYNCVYKNVAKKSWRILKSGMCTQTAGEEF